MPFRILLPLDGSSRAERAIPVSDCLAEALGAEVELLRVVDPSDFESRVGTASSTELVTSGVQLATDALRDAARRFRCCKPAACHVGVGSVVTTIVEQAHAGRFDLIVMSSHGYTGLEEKLLGSVARAVVRESHVPVLVLRERVGLPREARDLRVLVPLDGSALAEAVLPPLIPLA
jgi:nucleotide-binding universal stress UspA family protein